MISTRALRNAASADAALRRELNRGAAANPFLSEFYFPQTTVSEPVYLPPEHIGVVYGSMRARLSLGDTANLMVEGAEDSEEEEALRAEVEITLARRNADRPRTLRFLTVQIGAIRLGTHVEDVDMTVPHTRVEIGPGAEAVLIALVSIQCAELSLKTDRLIVETPSGGQSAAVYLEADVFDGASFARRRLLIGFLAWCSQPSLD